MVALGLKIQTLRKGLGWSAEKLAAEAEISWHAVYAYERGKREPKALALLHLARALGVAVDDLLDGIEGPYPGKKRKTAAS